CCVGSCGAVVVAMMVNTTSHCHNMLIIITVIIVVVSNAGSGWHLLALALVGLVMGLICHCCHCHPGPGGHIVNVDGRVVVVVVVADTKSLSSLSFWCLLHC